MTSPEAFTYGLKGTSITVHSRTLEPAQSCVLTTMRASGTSLPRLPSPPQKREQGTSVAGRWSSCDEKALWRSPSVRRKNDNIVRGRRHGSQTVQSPPIRLSRVGSNGDSSRIFRCLRHPPAMAEKAPEVPRRTTRRERSRRCGRHGLVDFPATRLDRMDSRAERREDGPPIGPADLINAGSHRVTNAAPYGRKGAGLVRFCSGAARSSFPKHSKLRIKTALRWSVRGTFIFSSSGERYRPFVPARDTGPSPNASEST